MDPLSDVLQSIRLRGAVFLDARFTAPWCVSSRITTEDCRPFVEAPAQLIAYHVILEGRVLLGIDNEPDTEACAGEIVLLPRNDAHTLASARGIAPVSADDLIQASSDGGLARIIHGGGGEATRLVCGFLASVDTRNPLLDALPRVLKLDLRSGTARDWIEASVRFAANELAEGRFAPSSVMSRLSELLLVEAVRHYASTLDNRHVGWLKGLRDLHVGRALALIHRDIGTAWSVEALAKEVALSRSAFMERFAALVGMPPIRYLQLRRLQTARLELRETRKTVAQIAHAVGYESDEAFSRAFKREFGLSPTSWRDAQSVQ
jgi:AraC-like DNA-binding protein